MKYGDFHMLATEFLQKNLKYNSTISGQVAASSLAMCNIECHGIM